MILTVPWDLYGHYLLLCTNINPYDFKEKYNELYKILHTTPFTYVIKMDQNRELDGIVQREGFVYSKDTPRHYRTLQSLNTYPCSLLEVLSAFAIRIDKEWIGDPSDPRPDVIFNEMLTNLGILIPDKKRDKWVFNDEEVKEKISKWLNREFDFYGNGSIFPLKNNYEMIDQREVEMWMQMTAYLRENWR